MDATLSSRIASIRCGDPGEASAALVECLPILFVAGRFAEAQRIGLALLRGTQVALPKGSALRPVVQNYFPSIAWALDVSCPAIDEQPAIDRADLERHLAEQAGTDVGFLVMNDAYYHGPPAVEWGEAYFERLDRLPRTMKSLPQVGAFLRDLARVLKERVCKALEFEAPEPLAELADVHHPELLERAKGFPAPESVAALSNRFLASRLASLNEFPHFGQDYLSQQCWTLLAVLFLSEDDKSSALEQLAIAFAAATIEPQAILRPALVTFMPFIELYRTGALASVVGASEEIVHETMLAFEHALSGVAPSDQSAATMDWSTNLQAFSQERTALIDECTLYGRPQSQRLEVAVRARNCLLAPAAAEELEEAEARLAVRLPPSYREFLWHSNGLVAPRAVANLLPVQEIDWFRVLEREYMEIWTKEDRGGEVEDERYFVYGRHQDCVWLRTRYLRTALQISDQSDGSVILLNPEVRFGEEWEAWHFGSRLPGAIRYRSFAELMQHDYFVPAPQWD